MWALAIVFSFTERHCIRKREEFVIKIEKINKNKL